MQQDINLIPFRLLVLSVIKGIPVKQISRETGIKEETIYHYMSRQRYRDPSVGNMNKISKTLGVKIDYIVNGEGHPFYERIASTISAFDENDRRFYVSMIKLISQGRKTNVPTMV